MGTVILVRHGENDWSSKNKLAGRTPGVHLNEAGHRQAEAVAKRLAALPVKAVYSSPITRCVETAAYIADTHQLAISHVDELGEIDYGKWEGRRIKALARNALWRAVQFFPSRARFPQGEALREVQFRAVQALEELAAKHRKELIVIVSHADIIRLLLAHYLGVHIDLFQRIVISPGSASIISLSQEGMVHVVRMNDDGPMQTPGEVKREKKGRKPVGANVSGPKKQANREAVSESSGPDQANDGPAAGGQGSVPAAALAEAVSSDVEG